jgi:hypothetical protein
VTVSMWNRSIAKIEAAVDSGFPIRGYLAAAIGQLLLGTVHSATGAPGHRRVHAEAFQNRQVGVSSQSEAGAGPGSGPRRP